MPIAALLRWVRMRLFAINWSSSLLDFLVWIYLRCFDDGMGRLYYQNLGLVLWLSSEGLFVWVLIGWFRGKAHKENKNGSHNPNSSKNQARQSHQIHIHSCNSIPNLTNPLLPRNLPDAHIAAQIRRGNMRAPTRIYIHLPDPHNSQLPSLLPIPPFRNQPFQPLACEILFTPESNLHGLGARHDLVDFGLDRTFPIAAYEACEFARGALGEVRGFEFGEVGDGSADGGADGAA